MDEPTQQTEVLEMDDLIQFNPNDTPSEPISSEPAVTDPVAADPTQTQAPAVPVQAQTPAQPTMVSIREAARSYGINLDSFPDDRQALAHLVNAARNNDYYANLGRSVAPHAAGLQQFLAQQRQQPQQAVQRQPWQMPEFDQRWLSLVERGDDGIIRAKAGVNPVYAEKVQEWTDWVQNFQQNPMGVLEPYLESRLGSFDQKVNEAVNQRFAQIQEQQAVQQTIAARSDILYQKDANGQVVFDPYTGKPQVSPMGIRYTQFVSAASQMGIRDPRQQDAYAVQQLQLEALLAQRQTQTAPAQQARATHAPNVNGARNLTEPTRRPAVVGATDPNQQSLSLADYLRRNMDAEGVTDNDFANFDMGS